MTNDSQRVLIIDDNRAIHEDFRKILGPRRTRTRQLLETEAALFGDGDESDLDLNHDADANYQIDFAVQGEDGVALVQRAHDEGRPYAMAFVDARMPPGLDGIETAAKIWEHDPDVQIVICTAYSDHSWEEIRRKLVYADRLVILKKPFDNIEVLQLAKALTERWRLAREDGRRLERLERMIGERNRELRALRRTAGESAAPAPQRPLPETETQLQRRKLAHELMIALEEKHLTLNYQPLVDIDTRRVMSLEALLRWRHPDRGYVPPQEFVRAAEEHGMIGAVGEFALRTACEQIARWDKQSVPCVRVAVNLSAVQLKQQDVVELVRKVLRETGVPPTRLTLELTESTFINDVERQVKRLQTLRSEGVHLQIDDFGTGYSSLSYLRHLPVDTLKIDQSFIDQLGSSASDESIIDAITRMAEGLRMRVVAEGVETESQLNVLRRHGCRVAQGFYFCRPVPPETCAELLLEAGPDLYLSETLRARLAVA